MSTAGISKGCCVLKMVPFESSECMRDEEKNQNGKSVGEEANDGGDRSRVGGLKGQQKIC